jgi:hypothetical protein
MDQRRWRDVDCNGLAEGPDRFMLVSSLSWIRRTRDGSTRRLTDVDTARPPITATARGRWISAPEPKPKARGASPAKPRPPVLPGTFVVLVVGR